MLLVMNCLATFILKWKTERGDCLILVFHVGQQQRKDISILPLHVLVKGILVLGGYILYYIIHQKRRSYPAIIFVL